MNFKGSTHKLKIRLSGVPAKELDVIIDYWLSDSASGTTSQLITYNRTTNGTSDVLFISGLSATQMAIVEAMVITNTDDSPFTVYVIAEYSGDERLWRQFNLNPGDTMEWTKHSSWHLFESSTTSDGIGIFPVQATDLVPANGNPIIYGMTLAGRDILKMGQFDHIQEALYAKPFVLWMPSSTGTWLGTTGASMGSAVAVNPTTNNLYTMMRRNSWSSVVTTANQQVGTRTDNQFYRGNAAYRGGFFAVCYFGFQSWVAGNRLYVGCSVTTTTVVTVQPSTLANMFGFCIEAGDTAITLLHNDASGTGVKETISGQPALANNNGYIAYIYCKPNDSVMYWRLDDILTQTKIGEGAITTELPDNATALNFQCVMSNGANVVAGNANIGVALAYIR